MTPIDPTDRTRLYESFGKAAREDTDDPFAGMMAVARAVCPEHHAVYDTRAHVAVPIEVVRRLKGAVEMGRIWRIERALEEIEPLLSNVEEAND